MSIGFFGFLGLILITLKLTGTIAIAWGWIVLTICAPLLFVLGAMVAGVAISAMCAKAVTRW